MIRSIRQLRHFLAAARCGSLHRAAKAEVLTQSALSKSLHQLEADIGGTLFERSVRGVTLTRFGEALYVRAIRVEAECALIEREMGDIASGRAGSLTIGAGSAWLSVFLPQVLAKLHAEKPHARFTVLRSSGPRFSEQFANGEIDIGLGSLDTINLSNDDYICEPLSVIETHFLAHAEHKLHQLSHVTLKDLTQYPWSMFRRDRELHSRIASIFTAEKLNWPEPTLSADSITTVLETVRLSPMITCLPSPLLPMARAMDVLALPTGISPWTFQTGVIYRKVSLGYRLLDEMLVALRDQFGDGAGVS